MKNMRFLTVLSLFVLMLVSCAPAQNTTATVPPVVATDPPIAALPTLTVAAPTLEAATEPVTTDEATALPVATSRGPDLHATDPTTVSLASGGLQFVEFFRFT